MKSWAKYLLTCTAIIIGTTLHGQAYAGIGAGVLANKTHLAVELQAGLNCNKWVIETGVHSPVDNTNPTCFQVKIGKQILLGNLSELTGLVGYGYQKMGKINDKGVFVSSLEYAHDFFPGYWYIQGASCGRNVFIIFGIKCPIRKEVKRWHGL